MSIIDNNWRQDTVPLVALATGVQAGNATPISASNPIPIASPSAAASTSTPLTGSTSATGVIGPFTPQLGRAINLALSGTWTGSVRVLSSTDGGTTKLPLTVGGSAWAVFTANCNEPVWEPTEANVTFYLDVTRSTGTITYRVSQ